MRLGLGRETGQLVAADPGSFSVRSGPGLHPEVIAKMRAINPARLGAANPEPFDHCMGELCRCGAAKGKCLMADDLCVLVYWFDRIQ
jgi:hypothetical protein